MVPKYLRPFSFLPIQSPFKLFRVDQIAWIALFTPDLIVWSFLASAYYYHDSSDGGGFYLGTLMASSTSVWQAFMWGSKMRCLSHSSSASRSSLKYRWMPQNWGSQAPPGSKMECREWRGQITFWPTFLDWPYPVKCCLVEGHWHPLNSFGFETTRKPGFQSSGYIFLSSS